MHNSFNNKQAMWCYNGVGHTSNQKSNLCGFLEFQITQGTSKNDKQMNESVIGSF